MEKVKKPASAAETKIFDPRDPATAGGAELLDASVVKRTDRWWMYLAGQASGFGATDIYSASLPTGALLSKRWAKGEDGEPKTESSDGYVPLHAVLAHFLRQWRAQTPYAGDGDFVFPSLRAKGRVPLSASIFVADRLRPAAKKAGLSIKDGQRFGLHDLRHSLSNWLVNKAKIEPKTVQGILRHGRIQTTLDLYHERGLR